MPPPVPAMTGAASLSDILSAVQTIGQQCQFIARRLNEQAPDLTSGQLAANTLVQTGFVRVTGISVVTAGAAGTLSDARTLAAAGSGDVVYTVEPVVGFLPVNMVFVNGLVYKPGAAQVVAIFYTRL